jgi:hypothetical protein
LSGYSFALFLQDALLEQHFPGLRVLDGRTAAFSVTVSSRSDTMFHTLSLFMKEFRFEGDNNPSSPVVRYRRAADIFRRASSHAARVAGARTEYEHFAQGRSLASRWNVSQKLVQI